MRTARRIIRSVVAAAAVGALLWVVSSPRVASACTGDCDGRDGVTVDEIVRVAAILLGDVALGTCPMADGNADGVVAIDDVIAAVNSAGDERCSEEPGTAVCGNGFVEDPEECDEGGICIGGATAGTTCTSDDACGADQPGACDGGTRLGAPCRANDDCPGSRCVRCKTFGGSGCAANCTYETSVTFTLVTDGMLEDIVLPWDLSNTTIPGEAPGDFSLPLRGTQTLTIGKERRGQIPVVIKAASVQFPKVPISTIGCQCIRGVAARTCGGTLFDEAMALAPDCSDESPIVVTCPAERPCTFVHGPGNSASGVIGCNGLTPIDVTTAGCEADTPPDPPRVTFSGTGPDGSAIIMNTLQVGAQTGPCTATFCTPADSITTRRTVRTRVYTTGHAQGPLPDLISLQAIAPLEGCSTQGVPFRCDALTGSPPSISGVTIGAAYPACDPSTVPGSCVAVSFVAE